jgi:hypothetical protein
MKPVKMIKILRKKNGIPAAKLPCLAKLETRRRFRD